MEKQPLVLEIPLSMPVSQLLLVTAAAAEGC
jgi:hypothetical protein